MNLSIGIVGLPNVGKSTLFNALLKQQVALAANYPFATIEPNVGRVPVPDARLAPLAAVVKTTKIVPAVVEFVDIAGLVKGASKGEGLGNQFLSHIRETMAICHVIRGFENDDIIREGSQNPAHDLDIIRTELQLADLATLEKQKAPKSGVTPAIEQRWKSIERFQKAVAEGKSVRSAVQNEQDSLVAKELGLITAKPELFVVNVDEAQLQKNDERVAHYAKELAVPVEDVVLISAQIESELAALTEEDQKAFLADLGLQRSGLERLIQAAYQKLGLQSFLTGGIQEARAWTIRVGSTAVDAAGEIHTDFRQKFIRAQVASYSDFLAEGGWKGVKEHGKLRVEGRDYVMRPDDVVEFMIGT